MQLFSGEGNFDKGLFKLDPTRLANYFSILHNMTPSYMEFYCFLFNYACLDEQIGDLDKKNLSKDINKFVNQINVFNI